MKTKITFQNRLYQDQKKQKQNKTKIQGLSYLCLSNIVFPVSIKWYLLE